MALPLQRNFSAKPKNSAVRALQAAPLQAHSCGAAPPTRPGTCGLRMSPALMDKRVDLFVVEMCQGLDLIPLQRPQV